MAHLALVPALLIGSALTAAGTVAASALSKQPSITPVATPTITQNPAAEAMRRSDLLRTRVGAAANDLTHGTAQAVTPGARALFGQGG